MILPSKKVLSIFILTAALVASIIITFGKDKTSSAVNFASNLVAGDKVSIPENPNWQDELGVVGSDTSLLQENSTTTEETTTDVMSRTLMANYLAMRQNNSLDNTSAQKLIDQTLAYVENTGGQTITASQLNVVADNGRISVAEYGDNLGNILKNNKPKDTKNEIEIIKAALSSEDSSKMDDLNSIITVYEKIAYALIKMPVPKTFVKAHLDVVNSIMGITSALKQMKIMFTDPIKGLSAMQTYQQSAILFAQVIGAINEYIKQNNIVYKQNSGGYYLLYGI